MHTVRTLAHNEGLVLHDSAGRDNQRSQTEVYHMHISRPKNAKVFGINLPSSDRGRERLN